MSRNQKALLRTTHWVLYCVVAQEAGSDDAYFKIGISQSLMKRLNAIKTGSPIPLVEVHSLSAFTYKNALTFEVFMHSKLEKYRSSGEWFKFNLKDEEHKRDFNDTARALVTPSLGAAGKWKRYEIGDFFERTNAARNVQQHLREMLAQPIDKHGDSPYFPAKCANPSKLLANPTVVSIREAVHKRK